jgi:hypothetical protein
MMVDVVRDSQVLTGICAYGTRRRHLHACNAIEALCSPSRQRAKPPPKGRIGRVQAA